MTNLAPSNKTHQVPIDNIQRNVVSPSYGHLFFCDQRRTKVALKCAKNYLSRVELFFQTENVGQRTFVAG